MMQAHEGLGAVIRMLRARPTAWAEVAIAALAPVDLWVCDIFNRCEREWLIHLGKRNGEVQVEAQVDPHVQVEAQVAADPGSSQNEVEP
jgi:hypothetical protein